MSQVETTVDKFCYPEDYTDEDKADYDSDCDEQIQFDIDSSINDLEVYAMKSFKTNPNIHHHKINL